MSILSKWGGPLDPHCRIRIKVASDATVGSRIIQLTRPAFAARDGDQFTILVVKK